MGDNASHLSLDNQPPVIRLLISLFFTVITGTIFFRIFIYCGSLIIGTGSDNMMMIPEQGAGQKEINILRYVQVSQQIGLFLIPSILLAILLRKGKESFLKMSRSPDMLNILMIAGLVIVIIPVITWTGIINSGMDLPDWLSGIEEKMREKEDEAAAITGFLIGSTGISGMTINLVILAIIPAFAEELLFRGIYQQLFIKFLRSPHAGIWITAILFSAIHFQFYGFFPRMILGLVFGYLFFWTGNLWAAIMPHFLNNAVPVVITFLSGQKQGMVDLNGEGRVFPFIHIIISALILYYCWRLSQKRSAE